MTLVSPRWPLLPVLGACAPKPAPPAVAAAVPPAIHVRCFEGLDGRETRNGCSLSSEGVTIALGAVKVLPACAARGGGMPPRMGRWPVDAAGWTPACYGGEDAFVCTLLVEATGRPGQPPADVLVSWTGQPADLHGPPTFGAPLAPFPTQPDAALDARGGAEVAVWPRVLGTSVLLDTACAGAAALP